MESGWTLRNIDAIEENRIKSHAAELNKKVDLFSI